MKSNCIKILGMITMRETDTEIMNFQQEGMEQITKVHKQEPSMITNVFHGRKQKRLATVLTINCLYKITIVEIQMVLSTSGAM